MLTLQKHPIPGARIPFVGATMPLISIDRCKPGKVLDVAILRHNPSFITVRYQDEETQVYNTRECAYIEIGTDILHDIHALQDIICKIWPRKIIFTYF